MGHHTIVYGRISGATWKTKDYYKLHRYNREVLDSLPETDAEYPWLNRSMFSIPNEQGVYRDQVITFGASYKTLEYEWHIWMDRFEELLKKLFWFDVTIHAEFEIMGKYQYHWEINHDLLGDTNWYKEIPEPVTEWKFEGNGPRTFEDAL